LQKENNSNQDKKVESAPAPKVELPPTGHTIKSSYQFEMIESMLGFALSSA
jgi:hypothetical protein